MTTAEYLATPETVRPQELAFGVWRVAESPTPRHQEAVLSLILAIHEYLQVDRVGTLWPAPLDVILDAERALVVQPDLFVISNERAHILTDRVRGAPDLVVEVLSPHPRVGDINERVQWFAQYGVRECWLVHQIDRWIDVLTFEGGKTAMRRRFAAARAHRVGRAAEVQPFADWDPWVRLGPHDRWSHARRLADRANREDPQPLVRRQDDAAGASRAPRARTQRRSS